MKKILALLVVLIAAYPALADINQKADLNGGNAIIVEVKQVAYNYGSGDINQDANVRVSGNLMMADQNSLAVLWDSNYAGNITNNLNGVNLVKVDLFQYGNNIGSGDIYQGIEVEVEGNLQILDQRARVIV